MIMYTNKFADIYSYIYTYTYTENDNDNKNANELINEFIIK